MEAPKNRITPDNITSVKENEVFVFGSNWKGAHGKGAAKQALTWGAKWGQAEGLQGRTYGLCTKDRSIRTLPINEIQKSVDRFVEFAKSRPDLTFLCSEVGCGLAGYKPNEIAPLFKAAIYVENIHLPIRFWRRLCN